MYPTIETYSTINIESVIDVESTVDIDHELYNIRDNSAYSTPINIRYVCEGDLSRLVAMEKRIFPDYPFSLEFFRRYVYSDQKSIFVAEAGNPPVICGYVACRHKENEIGANIDSLAVSPIVRGKRIGHRLLGHCLRFLYDQGRNVSLHVAKNNLVAISLYKSFGFEIMGEEANYYERADKGGDAFVMHLYHCVDVVTSCNYFVNRKYLA